MLFLFRLLVLIIVLMPLIGCAAERDKPIDMLDYILQKDDLRNQWTIGGTDVYADVDPDGTNARTFVLNKFSDPNCYEVYKVTEHEIQLRYEVNRAGGKRGDDNWIRRFEEIGGEGAAPGQVWMKRFMRPGEGFMTTFHQDRMVFNQQSRKYEIDRGGSTDRQRIWESIEWANNDWGRNNRTGFELNPCIRLISQWQPEGLILEMYDYSKGKGLVAWRWLERVDSLRPAEKDQTGKVFHCENGYVWRESQGDADHPPLIFKYDLEKATKGRQLEVVKFTSYWKPDLGPRWYVVYRDSTKERPLIRSHERIPHSYALPEWGEGKTLRDLPYLYTHPAVEEGKR